MCWKGVCNWLGTRNIMICPLVLITMGTMAKEYTYYPVPGLGKSGEWRAELGDPVKSPIEPGLYRYPGLCASIPHTKYKCSLRVGGHF